MSGYAPDGLTTAERDYIYGDPWEERDPDEQDGDVPEGPEMVAAEIAGP